MPGWNTAELSFPRESGGDDAVFEDAAAAIRDAARLGEALERSGDRLRLALGPGRQVLHEVVAEAAPGHEIGVEAAALRRRLQRARHAAHRFVGGEIGPVRRRAAARDQGVEATRPEG